ncbi:hypothetical protein F5X99DRAFT_427345 [Biscogniauxia marginata]|nr:hypothetical protein F5X99DRAFT_427345 [Biscogniauxia marginata]
MLTEILVSIMAVYANMDPSYALPSHDEDQVESLQGSPAPEASLHQQYPRQQPNIPLICSICPKNSTFSDISHLLTHVSSKGHLHNYFQLSISRETDEDAAFALAEFDNWFEENDINTLLRLRKSARAERGSQPQRRSQTPAIAQSGKVSRRSARGRRGGRGNRGSRTTTGNARTRYFSQQELEQIEIKDESDNDADFGIAYGSASGKASHSWQSDLTFPVDDNDDDDEDSKYEPSELYSPLPSEDTTEIAGDGTGALVLKGVVYPGMGGFDAAREDQRRQRNQRKDPAVLRRLKVSSESVTTTEEVLDYSLGYQRTRDVYDDPSIDGSMDEEEEVNDVRRRKRRSTRMNTAASAKKRRGAASSRQQTRASRGARATRSSTRATQPTETASMQPNVPSTRVTRSSASRQAQLPLHNHGLHPDSDFYHAVTGLEPDEGWTSFEYVAVNLWLTPDSQDTITAPSVETDDGSESNWSDTSSAKLTLRRNDRLPGLALRPGNPNLAFASPTLGLKKSPPSLYPGKENNHLVLKSPTSSSNPYLQTPGDSIENNNYNPLYVQPRDGFGFRTYSPYEEEPKSATGGFQAINGHDGLNSLTFSSHHNTDYHRNQNGGDVYGI